MIQGFSWRSVWPSEAVIVFLSFSTTMNMVISYAVFRVDRYTRTYEH